MPENDEAEPLPLSALNHLLFCERRCALIHIEGVFARRSLVAAWQERKQEEVTHSLLAQTTRISLLPYLQARILARVIRKELESYVPCVLK